MIKYRSDRFLETFREADDWGACSKVLPKEKHIIGKAYTIAIEQNNSNVRHFLALMIRRTKVVSKSEEMVDYTLRLCWYINENNGFAGYQKIFYLSLVNTLIFMND